LPGRWRAHESQGRLPVLRAAAAARRASILTRRSMLSRVRELMHEYPRAWWVAGGWAIDLHLGHQSRAHQDIDIAVLRRD